MASYDENGNLLEPVPGLGLASSPATELMTPGVTSSAQPSIAEPSVFAQLMTPGVTSSAQPSIAEPSVFAHPSTLPIPSTGTPGLNFTPSPPTQSEQEYLQSLPTTQKIGLALQAFSAGVAGRENPIESLLKQRRADLASNQARLNSTLDLAIKGQVLLNTLPEGSLQKAAIRRELSKMAPEISDFFNSTDEERKDEMQTIRTIKNPLVQKEVLNRCGGKSGSGFSKCVFDIVDDPKKMQTLRETAAESVWTPTMQALRPAIDQAKKQGLLDEYKQEDGTYRIPQEEAIELAEKSGIFKPEMIDAMRTFPERLVRFGVVPTETAVKVQEVGLSEEAKQTEKPANEKQPPTIDIGGIRYQFDPDNNLQGSRLERDPRYAALGPAKGPKEDRAPEKDTAKAERDRILLKISRGGTPDANEQRFMEVYAKTDPFKAAIGEAISNALGSKDAGDIAAPVTAVSAPTAADQNIIAARRRVEGLTEEPKDAKGKRDWRLAGNKLSTEAMAPGTSKAAGAASVQAKFAADATMTGNKLGKQTPNGYEVFDKKGKLIGYYR